MRGSFAPPHCAVEPAADTVWVMWPAQLVCDWPPAVFVRLAGSELLASLASRVPFRERHQVLVQGNGAMTSSGPGVTRS